MLHFLFSILKSGCDADIPFQTQSGSLNDATTEAVSSAVANLDQLSIGKERAPSLSENNSSVVLPNYLQAFSADCSHLSFGTYKSKGGSASNSWKGELLSEAGERSSAAPLNIRYGFFCFIPVNTYITMVSH